MRFLHHVPAPLLSDHVALLWLAETNAPGHARERLMPTGSMDLIIDFHYDTSSMIGAHSLPSVLIPRR